MRNMIFASAMLFATALVAQDYRIKITEIAKGSSVTYMMTNHIRQTHHFEGPVAGGYEVSFWKGRGKGLDAGVTGTALFNSDGRMLRYTQSGGKPVRYTPHNCFRVVGSCTYSVTRSDDSTREMGRRLVPIETGFEFESFEIIENGEKLLDSGHVALDHMGMMQTLTIKDSSTPDRPSLEQERAVYR